MFEPARYPTLVAVEAQGAFEATGDPADYNRSRAVDDFAFGLARVLDGIEALVRRRAGD